MIIRFEWVLSFISRIYERLIHWMFVVLVLIRMEKVTEAFVEGLNG